MKKLVILTSVLALTACGGGSGSGGGSAPIMPDAPVVPEEPFVDPVADSNSEITSMISNSEYQVARYVAYKLGDYASDVNLSRTATTRGAFVPRIPTGDTDYDTARELVDLAAWLVDDTTSESDIVEMFNKSTLDKNKIKSALKLMDDMYCFVGGDAVETARRIKEHDFDEPLADLQQKTTVFNLEDVRFITGDAFDTEEFAISVDETGKVNALNMRGNTLERTGDKTADFHTTISNGALGDITTTTSYESYGKQLGLRYADFGVLHVHAVPNTWLDKDEIMPYIGGYDDNMKINPNSISETVEFTGIAKGSVQGAAGTLPLEDTNAHLTVNEHNPGEEKLTAVFDNWYNVSLSKKDDLVTFSISGDYTGNYTLNTPTPGLSQGGDTTQQEAVKFDTAYYGESNNPTEAVVLFNYSQGNQPDGNDQDYTHVAIGFGGKR